MGEERAVSAGFCEIVWVSGGFSWGKTFTENSGQCLIRCKGGEEDEGVLRDVEMCALGLRRQ